MIEGENERIAAIARYLRASGVDITLLKYNYYRTESNEEILQIERQVGDENAGLPKGGAVSSPTEDDVLNVWTSDGRQAYSIFRERMIAEGLIVKPKKTGLSFYKQTPDDVVFVCFVYDARGTISFWLRSDSLQSRFDFQAAAESLRAQLSPDVRINHTPTWFILYLPSIKIDLVTETAELILRHIVSRIE